MPMAPSLSLRVLPLACVQAQPKGTLMKSSPRHIEESTQAASQHLLWPSDLQTSVSLSASSLRFTISRECGTSPSSPLSETHEGPRHQHQARVGKLGWLNVTPQKTNLVHRLSRSSITLLGSDWTELIPTPPSEQLHTVPQAREDHSSHPWYLGCIDGGSPSCTHPHHGVTFPA